MISRTCAQPIRTMSLVCRPRVVQAGVPSRSPCGFIADTSPGTVFLLVEMLIISKILSAMAPGRPWRTQEKQWTTVQVLPQSFSPHQPQSNVLQEPCRSNRQAPSGYRCHPIPIGTLCRGRHEPMPNQQTNASVGQNSMVARFMQAGGGQNALNRPTWLLSRIC